MLELLYSNCKLNVRDYFLMGDVCVPDGRWSGCLLSLWISYFPTHQTSVIALDSGWSLLCSYIDKNFLQLSLFKAVSHRGNSQGSGAKEVASALPLVLCHRNMLTPGTGSQLGVLPAAGCVTELGCTTEQCSPSSDFTMTPPESS